MNKELESFGRFLVRNLRDRMLYDRDMLLRGEWKAPDLQNLQERLTALSTEDQATVRDLVDQVITTGMHDLLFALQEESDAEGPIRVMVNGKDVAQLSDGLHGEIFGEDGWISQYSEYPAESQKELSRWAEKEILDLLKNKEEEDG